MVIGYLRVSTIKQDLEKDRFLLLEYGNKNKLGNIEWVEEVISTGINWKDRKLGELINEKLVKGDIIVVTELSRLARSVLEFLEIVNVCLEKGVFIYAVKNDYKLDSSQSSKLMAYLYAIMYELERDFIRMRTKEAMRVRKEKGLPIGRPKGVSSSKLDPYKEEITGLLTIGVSKTNIAKKYGISLSGISRFIKRNNIENKNKK